jgi:polar amino acid transport system substrate-binding protein
MQQGGLADQVFALLSYPESPFVRGDLYLYVLDFNGMIVAQGDRPGLIGTSAWDATDARGKKINQEIIKKLKESATNGIWIEYVSKKAEKKSYAEMVTDNTGKQYFIACGYYPDADRAQVIDLVRQGFRYMKASGLTSSADAITDKRNDQFRYGDLYLEVYTLQGECIANGNNQDLVGKNFWDITDQAGKFYVRDMIKRAEDGPGWVDYKLRNLFKSSYVEKIDLGTNSYILTCGLYPISKREGAILLVKSAADYFVSAPRHEALHEFVATNGKFIRGDLSVFVFDFSGLCLAYGDDHALIWRNLANLKDEDGKSFVRLFINTVKSGPGQVSLRLNGARKVAYIEAVEKDGKSYVVGSSYYL